MLIHIGERMVTISANVEALAMVGNLKNKVEYEYTS